MSDTQNRWIWPFELLEKLGEGGMGVVYRARYVKNNKQVAVKILPDDVSDPVILGRFDRELEILRKLRHNNIVHCFGGTTEGKHRFYAMEVVEGGSFDKLLTKRGQLPWEIAVRYAQQMAAGLEHAHELGVTHRDVKPGNFLIGSSGQLKLSDFGLATFAAARNLTATGKTMGTFRYMAPEQIRGKEVGPQSDLYSLGCVIYEMLTGKPPFDGSTAAEILDQHLHKDPPRVTATVFDCPASLDLLVTSLLQKDPARRPASATQVSQMLAEVSPMVMVSTNPIQDARTTAAVPISGSKSDFSFWRVPAWAIITLIVIPLLWFGWTLSLRSRALEAEESLGLLRSMWEKGEGHSKELAAEALGSLARHNEDALDILVTGMNSTDENVKVAALKGLAKAGPAASSLKEQIGKINRLDESQTVRNTAHVALESIKAGGGVSSDWSPTILAIVGMALIAGYLIARKFYADV